jgi:hypothetical protein
MSSKSRGKKERRYDREKRTIKERNAKVIDRIWS